MTGFAAGLLHGFADGKEATNERKERDEERAMRRRELDIMEVISGRTPHVPQDGADTGQGTPTRAAGRAGIMGNTSFNPANLPSFANEEMAMGIYESAEALGVDPLDLATAISYETAGTFNPRTKGPTTQWGQHEGLIQFGKPQAAEHGVDWNNPLGSQLGPNGAVVSYLKSTGVKPGMGLMDIYSAINAGGVGRYGASDANNGGAPGDVRDKVTNQMHGHRAKAAALLKKYGNPAAMPASTDTPTAANTTATPTAASPAAKTVTTLNDMMDQYRTRNAELVEKYRGPKEAKEDEWTQGQKTERAILSLMAPVMFPLYRNVQKKLIAGEDPGISNLKGGATLEKMLKSDPAYAQGVAAREAAAAQTQAAAAQPTAQPAAQALPATAYRAGIGPAAIANQGVTTWPQLRKGRLV